MFELKKIARLLAATAICCTLANSAKADDKMGGKMMDHKMGGKMDPKMGGKMMDHKMGGKMMGGKMDHGMMDHEKMMMGKMSASDKKTYMGMSKSEKMLVMKVMHMGKM